ncbi:hypothetical protein QQ045_007902 [Rhodiola kirilowii]
MAKALLVTRWVTTTTCTLQACLKSAALARLSVVHRSLRVAKSGPKKRNRQATPRFHPGNDKENPVLQDRHWRVNNVLRYYQLIETFL